METNRQGLHFQLKGGENAMAREKVIQNLGQISGSRQVVWIAESLYQGFANMALHIAMVFFVFYFSGKKEGRKGLSSLHPITFCMSVKL